MGWCYLDLMKQLLSDESHWPNQNYWWFLSLIPIFLIPSILQAALPTLWCIIIFYIIIYYIKIKVYYNIYYIILYYIVLYCIISYYIVLYVCMYIWMIPLWALSFFFYLKLILQAHTPGWYHCLANHEHTCSWCFQLQHWIFDWPSLWLPNDLGWSWNTPLDLPTVIQWWISGNEN